MFESTNSRIYKIALRTLTNIGNGTATPESIRKRMKEILMYLNDELDVMYAEGLNVAPDDGEYKIYIDDMHILTKRIRGLRGKNFPAWPTKIPKSPWRAAIEKYEIPMMGFRVVYNSESNSVRLEYDDVEIVDLIKQAQGLPSTWVGKFLYKEKLRFMFRMVKT